MDGAIWGQKVVSQALLKAWVLFLAWLKPSSVRVTSEVLLRVTFQAFGLVWLQSNTYRPRLLTRQNCSYNILNGLWRKEWYSTNSYLSSYFKSGHDFYQDQERVYGLFLWNRRSTRFLMHILSWKQVSPKVCEWWIQNSKGQCRVVNLHSFCMKEISLQPFSKLCWLTSNLSVV